MSTTPQVTPPQAVDRANSVVSTARYDQGLTWADFLSQAPVNRDKLEAAYKSNPLSTADIAFFKAAAALPNGPVKIMAIAESWCPDVCRELPVVERIAETTGMSVRIFLRDQNADIMDEFVSNNGKSRAMPVIVFYTTDTKYITHFTERSVLANTDLAAIMTQAKIDLKLPPTATFATLEGADRQAFVHEVVRHVTPRAVEWQKASIHEMRQKLADALGIPNPAEAAPATAAVPVIYTIRGCDSCTGLIDKWKAEGRSFEERRVELGQATLEEARKFGDVVPIVVYPDGKVEQGFEGKLGCFII